MRDVQELLDRHRQRDAAERKKQLVEHMKTDLITDSVNHPAHYNQGKFEVIDVISDFTKQLPGNEGFLAGNAIKYIARSEHKGGLEDLNKARWYLDRWIAERKEREE